MVKKTTLDNGLRVLTAPQDGTRTVTATVLVGTGSKNETKEESGISHFLEHMFFKGTKKRPKPLDVSRVLDRVGGSFNAFTSEDQTLYFAKVDSSHLETAVDWVADIFLNSLLPPREVAREKGVVTEEMNIYRDDPKRHVYDLWRDLLYGDQPAGWDIIGNRETIASMSKKALEAYKASQYVASNTVVVVAGSVSEEKALRIVSSRFSGVKTGKFRSRPELREGQNAPGLLVRSRKTEQTNIMFGGRGVPLSHPDRFAQELLAVVLGGMMSSRLFVEVREKHGLAYSVHTTAEPEPELGFVVTQAGVQNENALKAVRTIKKEYDKVSRTLLPAEELNMAKENIKGRLALALESSSERAVYYGTQELLEGRLLPPERMYDMIDQVEPEDVRRVARRVFASENLNLVVLGPQKDKRAFSEILSS